ncbi:MAG TPA: hypothetical protein VGF23_07055 [Gaiellaceae bacterium]
MGIAWASSRCGLLQVVPPSAEVVKPISRRQSFRAHGPGWKNA